MPSRRSLTIAAALAAMAATAVPAAAQESYGVGRQSMRAKHDAAIAARKAKDGDVETPALYPQAPREQPEAKASRQGLKKLQALQETYQAGDAAATLAAANAIANDPDANAYEKSFALQVAGNAASNEGDDAAAADFFARSLAANGLDNNNHYTVMFNLAVVRYGMDQYEQALQTVEQFIAETKTDKLEAQTLRGGILVALERYDDAAALYTGLMAAHPDDRTLRMNAVAAYQAADQMDKAAELLAQAQAAGQLADANEYRALYVTYINSDRDKDAIAVIEDGLAKGILQPGPDLAKDYMVLGQRAYFADDDATAIEMYKHAASMATDGEALLNLAKIHAQNGRKAEARATAQRALDKGVKDPADARKLLGGG
jgi:tetratricopeptide (TPR) repeat protein